MKTHPSNKALSSVIATSILLAAVLTIATVFQAFIVPQLDREQAFIHSQKILQNFKELYTKEATTIQLAHAGFPFFSATTYPGQVSYTPSVSINLNAYNIIMLKEEETLLDKNATINMQSLSYASLFLKNVVNGIKTNITFTNSKESLYVQLQTENYGNEITLIKIQLTITTNSDHTVYNYITFAGNPIELHLSSPLYGLTSILHKTTQVQYTTNSPSCLLFLKYLTTTTTNVKCMAQGAIIYKPSNFPLSYITTPWGVTALQGGTSAIPSTMRIYWAKDVLVLSLYNITWSNIGTISGSGSIGIKLKPQNQVSINSSVSMLQLNCSCGRFNLKNSLLQLKTLLQNDAPENILLSYEEGSDWLMITVTSTNTAKINMKLLIRNVEAVLD